MNVSVNPLSIPNILVIQLVYKHRGEGKVKMMDPVESITELIQSEDTPEKPHTTSELYNYNY